jgi:2-iminobutanoate/2-iminopropanoate deaminase
MDFVFTENAPKPIGPYSQAVKHKDTLYISGQIGINPSTGKLVQDDIQTETEQVLKNIEAILQAENLRKESVVKCSIFISDMDQFSQINEAYSKFFGSHSPARETVEVSRLPAGANVEISVIASIF